MQKIVVSLLAIAAGTTAMAKTESGLGISYEGYRYVNGQTKSKVGGADTKTTENRIETPTQIEFKLNAGGFLVAPRFRIGEGALEASSGAARGATDYSTGLKIGMDINEMEVGVDVGLQSLSEKGDAATTSRDEFRVGPYIDLQVASMEAMKLNLEAGAYYAALGSQFTTVQNNNSAETKMSLTGFGGNAGLFAYFPLTEKIFYKAGAKYNYLTMGGKPKTTVAGAEIETETETTNTEIAVQLIGFEAQLD